MPAHVRRMHAGKYDDDNDKSHNDHDPNDDNYDNDDNYINNPCRL